MRVTEKQTITSKFNLEWQPHFRCIDSWLARGVLQNAENTELYIYFAAANSFRVQGMSYLSVELSLADLARSQRFDDKIIYPWNARHKHGIFIDNESLIAGEFLQFLLDRERALAARLHCDDWGLDIFFERKKRAWITSDSYDINDMLNNKTTLSQMNSIGRLQIGEEIVNVRGRSCVEHLWGNVSFSRCKAHWERFYLFMHNGDELTFTVLPQAAINIGVIVHADGSLLQTNNFSLEDSSHQEVKNWRYATSWKLNLPGYGSEAFSLSPLLQEEFHVPEDHAMIEVRDSNKQLVGYGVAEVMIGARSSVKSISSSLFIR